MTFWNLNKVEEVKDKKMTSSDWHKYTKKTFLIVKATGWENYPESFYDEKITKEEFEKRVSKSEISITGGMVSLKEQLFGK